MGFPIPNSAHPLPIDSESIWNYTSAHKELTMKIPTTLKHYDRIKDFESWLDKQSEAADSARREITSNHGAQAGNQEPNVPSDASLSTSNFAPVNSRQGAMATTEIPPRGHENGPGGKHNDMAATARHEQLEIDSQIVYSYVSDDQLVLQEMEYNDKLINREFL
jgi:hypothetical protein